MTLPPEEVYRRNHACLKRWRENNRGRHNGYHRKYYQKNKERIKERSRSRLTAPNKPDVMVCKKCGAEKPFTLEFFGHSYECKWKLSYSCKECCNMISLNRFVQRRYGVTHEEAVQLRQSPCEICGHKGKMVIDHNHTTGARRGILCSPCNSGIGQFRESASAMRSAAEYVERHNGS